MLFAKTSADVQYSNNRVRVSVQVQQIHLTESHDNRQVKRGGTCQVNHTSDNMNAVIPEAQTTE
jgi:hypothetical protein